MPLHLALAAASETSKLNKPPNQLAVSRSVAPREAGARSLTNAVK